MPQALAPPNCIQVQMGEAQFQESDQAGPYPSSAPTYCLISGRPSLLRNGHSGLYVSSSDTTTGGPAGKEEKAINAEVVG